MQSSTPKKRLVIDLDGTLCDQRRFGEYHLAQPRQDVIDKVNALWNSGEWTITIFTARGMGTYEDDVEKIPLWLREEAERWLDDHHVCYDRLIFGKPSGDLYVDDKGCYIHDFLAADF